MQSPLRNVRKAHGFTLQHVAAGVQVNPATLSRIERLEQIPSIELAERLANFFKGEVSEMQILYPNRDKPYTEDLGKITFRPSITAYVVGDDCFDQRDRLIEALNKPGPGTLVHPTYGELKVCVDGEVRVSTSKSEGRIVRFDLKFVEAGELSYPTSGGRYFRCARY